MRSTSADSYLVATHARAYAEAAFTLASFTIQMYFFPSGVCSFSFPHSFYILHTQLVDYIRDILSSLLLCRKASLVQPRILAHPIARCQHGPCPRLDQVDQAGKTSRMTFSIRYLASPCRQVTPRPRVNAENASER